MKIIFVVALLLFPFSAMAQTSDNPECVVVQKAEVGAEYVPGVDVDGNPVAPAELNAPAVSAVPDPMIVPVTVDIAKRVGLSVQGLEMSGNTGFLEVYRNGRVLYNGQDLTQKVKAICGRAPEIPAPVPSFDPDRQTVTKDIEYAPDNKPMPAAPVSTPSGQ